ncbi:MAG: NAD(+) diphosphatase [Proteobacteria bacterium]|nr:NAD(+) diphosphatase [Pseudomonadota bacterium]
MSDDTPRFIPSTKPSPEASSTGYWFAFRKRELLVTESGGVESLESLETLGLSPLRTQFLGMLGDTPCHSAELPDDAPAPAGMRFRDLRMLYGQVSETLAALAGRAVQIVEWDRQHQFCGACAAPTKRAEHDRSRLCTQCGLAHFPRLSPAIIVAVERGEEILLARGPQFPPGIYSVLAGFVDPGESVEDAVHREVEEEVGIRVRDVRYFGSQPWPFPNSLMLGFTAQYASGEIRPDLHEIEDAGWYRADALPNVFPGRISISQWLLHDFLERQRA